MSLSPGIRLGPYEILAPLGAGGMGEVWRARDLRLGREVAIKVLPSVLSQQWSADGRAVFVRRGQSISGPTARIFRIDLESGRAELFKELVLADPAGAHIATPIVMAPDARSYAYPVQRTLSQLYLVEGLR